MSAIYVYPELEIIFIHLPKCAGTTILKHLEKATNKREQYHAHIPDQYASFWKFTVCRNPFDRFVSAWRYCLDKGWHSHKSPLSFLNHVKNLEGTDHPVVSHYHSQFRDDFDYMVLHHSAPMSHPHRLITPEVEVYRYEELELLVDDISGWYDVKLDKDLRANPTEHDPFQVYYDSALFHQVLDYYEKDFEQFNYPRALPLRSN